MSDPGTHGLSTIIGARGIEVADRPYYLGFPSTRVSLSLSLLFPDYPVKISSLIFSRRKYALLLIPQVLVPRFS